MFEMLKYRCRICGGYTDHLIVGDRCLACAYTPSGRPIGPAGWEAGIPLREPDWQALFDAACRSEAPRPGLLEEEEATLPEEAADLSSRSA